MPGGRASQCGDSTCRAESSSPVAESIRSGVVMLMQGPHDAKMQP